MKKIKYNFCTRVNHGTEESPNIEKILTPVEMGWNEANEAIAKREAHNGEYEIVDDGQPDPSDIPTQLDMIEAQVTYTALMTDTLLATEDIEVEEDSTDGSNSTGETEIESNSPVEDNVETSIEETEKEQLDEVENTPVEPENQKAFIEEETTLVEEVETDVSEN